MAPRVLWWRPMKLMGLVVLVGLCRVATAGPARDTIGPFLMWIGGSLHYEHRAADSNLGLTPRASVTPGVVIGADEDAEFTRVTGIVGVRRHWTHAYLEAAAGWSAFRHARVLGPDDEHFGIHWDHGPRFYGELAAGVQALRSGRYVDDYDRRHGITYDVYPAGELAVGARFGPVDVSLFTPGFGLGLRIGGVLDVSVG